MIIRGTNSSIKIRFSQVDPSKITVAYLTIKQTGAEALEKNLNDATVGSDYLEWILTQAETLALYTDRKVTIQCRYKVGETAGATLKYTESVYDILKDGEI